MSAPKRQLGRTGLQVNPAGFGAWAIGGGVTIGGFGIGYGQVNDADSRAAMERAVELGVNFIDTADAYGAGHSEETIGEVFGGRWDGICVATKVGNERRDPLPGRKNFGREYVIGACETSLKRLKKDVIDLYQLHGPPEEVVDQGEIFETLATLKQQGKIRFVGVSVNEAEQGLRLVKDDLVDVLQVRHNLLDRKPEKELYPLAQEKNVGIIARVPLASGILCGKFSAETTFAPDDQRCNWLKGDALKDYAEKMETLKGLLGEVCETPLELALRYLLNCEAVAVTIAGAKNVSQIEGNVAACDKGPLPEAFLKQLMETVEPWGPDTVQCT